MGSLVVGLWILALGWGIQNCLNPSYPHTNGEFPVGWDGDSPSYWEPWSLKRVHGSQALCASDNLRKAARIKTVDRMFHIRIE